ncbi:hypothetical protein B0H17DRAFT_1217191 [Mycena rosella]|uniref:Uncharacterized protein n=1 Tax=Mycena rosella TaxID=1033263 RepID=A0AAD7FT18_MYCRO|nr:hypothetical protein B0H17DRAFT_1217191 [Mycena rosella]
MSLTAAQTSDIFLRSLLYPASVTPAFISAHTRCRGSDPQALRYPCVESVLDCAAFQPHVHDLYVTVKHGRHTSRFRLFFKRHIRLPDNPNVGIRGDLLIMRVASRNEASVVNMRLSDRKLVDYVVKNIAPTIYRFQGRQRIRLPSRLQVVKK